MTCENCLHYERCKKLGIFNIETLSVCEDFTARSEWVHLPCKLGNHVFIIPTKENSLEEITEMKVLGFSIGEPCNNANCFRIRGTSALFQPSFDDFGKTVFLTHEEAEKALEGKK